MKSQSQNIKYSEGSAGAGCLQELACVRDLRAVVIHTRARTGAHARTHARARTHGRAHTHTHGEFKGKKPAGAERKSFSQLDMRRC